MRCLAVDIGAESGRGIVGNIRDGHLAIDEVHRFANVPLRFDGSLRWDLDLLTKGVQECIAKAGEIESVGIDTWGVDFVLLGARDEVLEPPYHHRDSLTDGVMQQVFEVVCREEIYGETGIQFLPFNSLYQLYAMKRNGSKALKKARTFLTIPDYLNFVLSGKKRCEFTNATTTQCFNPRTRDWAWELLHRLEIPGEIFPEVIQPGTRLGSFQGIEIIAPACHDTGSAVAGVCTEAEDFAWISSGTWSIMGVNSPIPIITAETCRESFTNEGGINQTYRFSKNVMGLWLLQQCRANWETCGEKITYSELAKLAANSRETAIFDVDDPQFLKPGNMPSRIEQVVGTRGMSKGDVARVVLNSLAAKYALTFEALQRLSGRALRNIHIVGGGSQNELLNELTANACGVPVIAGPAEATAIGNLRVQMNRMAAGGC